MSFLTSIDRECGRSIYVSECLIRNSTAGWLEGYPDPQAFLKVNTEYARDKFYYMPLRVLTPMMVEFFPGRDSRPVLPRYSLLVGLECLYTPYPEEGSDDYLEFLAVLWFEQDIMDRPLQTVLQDALHRIGWRMTPEDYPPDFSRRPRRGG